MFAKNLIFVLRVPSFGTHQHLYSAPSTVQLNQLNFSVHRFLDAKIFMHSAFTSSIFSIKTSTDFHFNFNYQALYATLTVQLCTHSVKFTEKETFATTDRSVTNIYDRTDYNGRANSRRYRLEETGYSFFSFMPSTPFFFVDLFFIFSNFSLKLSWEAKEATRVHFLL